MNLEVAQNMNAPEWMKRAETQKLMKVIGGAEKQSLFVGGCVRNEILEVSVKDIDIATIFTPEEIIDKLKDADIKAIPTGIDHGTVTAVVDGKPFEITTLRKDDETDGRRAKVSYTEDWQVDAMRRDFTMNTLLADIEGNVYDPTGQGLDDLKARKVAFVGEPAERIKEDYLRVLRLFRFHAFYGKRQIDEVALEACKEAADHISTLSRERITSEFLKIISVDHAADILKIMFDHNILTHLFDEKYNPELLNNLCALQIDNNAVGLMPRLFVLGGNKARFHGDTMRFSHAQKNFLVKLEMAFNPALYADEKALKKAIFYNSNDLLLQGYLLLIAAGKVALDNILMDVLKNWHAPKCPITGADLIKEGYVTGPDLGLELTRRQEEWLEDTLS